MGASAVALAVSIVCSAHDHTAWRMSLADDNYLSSSDDDGNAAGGRVCVRDGVIQYSFALCERRDPSP